MKKIFILFAIVIVAAAGLFVWHEYLGPTPQNMVITSQGVGEILLGKPIPNVLLKRYLPIDSIYFFSYFADGLPIEGFNLPDPPIKVTIKNGPFKKWDDGTKNSLEFDPPRAAIIEEIKKMNPDDMIVKFIMIESDKVRTDKGAGVGSTLKDLEDKHGIKFNNPVPPSFGGDEFVAALKGLQNVFFYFKDKKTAEKGGGVIRIGMWLED